MFITVVDLQVAPKPNQRLLKANYYASRGWVFASIDYRTTEGCVIQKRPSCETRLETCLLKK